MSKYDLELLKELRRNGTCQLNNAFERLKLKMKRSTIYEKVRNNGGLIKNNTVLLDYSKLGYEYHILFSLKNGLQRQSILNDNIFSELCRFDELNNCWVTDKDIFGEAIFKTAEDIDSFKNKLEYISKKKLMIMFVSDFPIREHFLLS